jgi:hypothetical protein
VAAPVEAAALEGLDVVPFVSVCTLDVEQQVGNTCAPRALITALKSIYCPTELEATSFKDIDQKAEGVGAEWLQPHLDAYDIEQRIIVIESISMISDTQHHQLYTKQLTAVLKMFVSAKTTSGLIVSTATAHDLDACLGLDVQAPGDGLCAPRDKWWYWIYLEVNFEDMKT